VDVVDRVDAVDVLSFSPGWANLALTGRVDVRRQQLQAEAAVFRVDSVD
jgi:hypothetical protein